MSAKHDSRRHQVDACKLFFTVLVWFWKFGRLSQSRAALCEFLSICKGHIETKTEFKLALPGDASQMAYKVAKLKPKPKPKLKPELSGSHVSYVEAWVPAFEHDTMSVVIRHFRSSRRTYMYVGGK